MPLVKIHPYMLAAIVAWLVVLLFLGAVRPLIAPAHQRDRGSPGQRRTVDYVLGASDIAISLAMPFVPILAGWLSGKAHFGLLNWLDLPSWAAIAISFVGVDFLAWFDHWLAHRIPAYWRLHQVHHSDRVFDVLTTYRQHPLASFVRATIVGLGTALLGLDPIGIIAFHIALAFHLPFIHGNIRWPVPSWVPRTLGHVFITPTHHGRHHSSLSIDANQNLGQMFSFWDRMAGTLNKCPAGDSEAFPFGIEERANVRPDSLGDQLMAPFR